MGGTGRCSNFVFIDDLSRVYTAADERGYTPDSPSTDSSSAPFAGKTPFECSALLQKWCRDTGEKGVMWTEFAIIDETSLQDGTLLLVGEPEETDGGAAQSVRWPFRMAEMKLALYLTGDDFIEDDREEAEGSLYGIVPEGW
ncbi:hypothetical protein MBLNU457_7410t2 [Dothideomycetes sp. NU457]